jgi:hypothetical protein
MWFSNAEGVHEVQPRVGRTLGRLDRKASTLKALANAFSVEEVFLPFPRVVASSNSGLELVNAFGVGHGSWSTLV